MAREFTRPVVFSVERCDGSCDSGIGAFVVVNPAGWIVTAWHIAKMFSGMVDQCEKTGSLEHALATIEADTSLSVKEKKRKKSQVRRPRPQDLKRCSALWGWPDVRVEEVHGVEAADLAVCQLQNFKPEYISRYPRFKDPARSFDVGTSLCKHGYPFHQIAPTFNEQSQQFDLPPGAYPPPIFPIEGIFARTVNIESSAFVPPPPYALRFLETSTPGLKGQSGGPITDSRGGVWAIQSQTRHYPLGFSPEVSDAKGLVKEHQFLWS